MLSFALPLSLALVAPPIEDGDEIPVFAEPVRLRAGEDMLGNDRYYPSPVLRDLDGDGVAELVVGDLTGRILVSRRLPGDDLTAWSAPEPLKKADGEPLRFHNW